MSETTPEVPEVEPDEPTRTVEEPEIKIWLDTWESQTPLTFLAPIDPSPED